MEDVEQEVQLLSAWTVEKSMLLDLWREDKLCDVTLRSHESYVKSHKIILSANSPFFRAMFTGSGQGMAEGQSCQAGESIVDLKGLESWTLKVVIESLYTGTLPLSWDTVGPLLATSHFLSLTSLIRACQSFLAARLQVNTCMDVLGLAAAYHCEGLLENSLCFAASNFNEVLDCEGGEGFESAGEQAAVLLLARDDLQVSCEVEVLRAALRWLEADTEHRTRSVKRILHAVRLSLIPSAVIEQELASHPLMMSSEISGGKGILSSASEVRAVIREQIKQLKSSPSTSVGSTCIVGSPQAKRRRGMLGESGGMLVAVGGHDEGWRSLRTVELFQPEDSFHSSRTTGGRWIPGPPMDASLSFVGSARAKGFLYVLGGSTFHSTVLRLETPTQQQRQQQQQSDTMENYNPLSALDEMSTTSSRWQSLASLPCPCVHSAVSELAGKVYVTGGRSRATTELSTVVRYDAELGSWSSVADMRAARVSHGAASLGGRLYVVGGQGGRFTFRSVEEYDPGSDTWNPLASMLGTERKYLGVCQLDRRIFAVGGMNQDRTRLASVEALDPREGRWRELPPMSVARSSFGVVVFDGRLVVAGGGGSASESQQFGAVASSHTSLSSSPGAPLPSPFLSTSPQYFCTTTPQDPNLCHDSVEAFCPYTNRWSPLPSLSVGRSGLSLGAI